MAAYQIQTVSGQKYQVDLADGEDINDVVNQIEANETAQARRPMTDGVTAGPDSMGGGRGGQGGQDYPGVLDQVGAFFKSGMDQTLAAKKAITAKAPSPLDKPYTGPMPSQGVDPKDVAQLAEDYASMPDPLPDLRLLAQEPGKLQPVAQALLAQVEADNAQRRAAVSQAPVTAGIIARARLDQAQRPGMDMATPPPAAPTDFPDLNSLDNVANVAVPDASDPDQLAAAYAQHAAAGNLVTANQQAGASRLADARADVQHALVGPANTDDSATGKVISGLESGYGAIAKQGFNVLRSAADFAGFDNVEAFARSAAQAAQVFQDRAMGVNAGSTVSQAISGMVPMLTLGFGAKAGIAAMATGMAGDAYAEARDNGASPTEALSRGGAFALANIVSMHLRLPAIEQAFSKMATGLPTAQLGAALADATVKNVGIFGAQTLANDIYDKVGQGGQRRDLSLSDVFDHLIDSTKIAAVTSAVLPGLPLAVSAGKRGLDIARYGRGNVAVADAINASAVQPFEANGAAVDQYVRNLLRPDPTEVQGIAPRVLPSPLAAELLKAKQSITPVGPADPGTLDRNGPTVTEQMGITPVKVPDATGDRDLFTSTQGEILAHEKATAPPVDTSAPPLHDPTEPAFNRFTNEASARKFITDSGLDGKFEPVADTEGWTTRPVVKEQTLKELSEAQQDVQTQLNPALARTIDGHVGGAEAVSDREAGTLLGEPARALVSAIRAAFGLPVTFVRGSGAGGAFFQDRVYLDADVLATKVRSNDQGFLVALAGHELWHPYQNSDNAAQLDAVAKVRAVVDKFRKAGTVDDRIAFESDGSKRNVTEAYAKNEIDADLNGGFWWDQKFWGEVIALDKDGSIGRKLFYHFMQSATKLGAALKGSRYDAENYVTNVDAVRTAFAEAWASHFKTGTPESNGKASEPIFSHEPPVIHSELDSEGNPEFASRDVTIAFPQPTQRVEVIPTEHQRVLNYVIMPAGGFTHLGHVTLVTENGKPTSLLDIEIAGKNKGIGRQVIETLLAANPKLDLNISNIVDEARGFWGKMGVPEQNLERGAAYDGTLNWKTYVEARDPGAAARALAGREAEVGQLDAPGARPDQRLALDAPRSGEGREPGAADGLALSRKEDAGYAKADVEKADAYERATGVRPYIHAERVEVSVEIQFSLKETGKYGEDPLTGLPINKNGTVTLYYPTTAAEARRVSQEKVLRAVGDDHRIYLTNESSGWKIAGTEGRVAQTTDGSAVMLQVDPRMLQFDALGEGGRKDFFIPAKEGEFYQRKMSKLWALHAPRDSAIRADVTIAKIKEGTKAGLEGFLGLQGKDRQLALRAAKDVLRNEHNVGTLLGVNGKLEKTNSGDYGLTHNDKSVVSMGLGMASAQKINDKLTTCPQSAICEGLCLADTSGQNLLYGGMARGAGFTVTARDFRSGPRLSQYLKTEAFVVHPEEFAIVLHDEISKLEKWAKANDYSPSIRLNVTTDIPPSVWEPLIQVHPDTTFYDYTKLASTPVAENHHLTYSSTGASQVVNGETIVNKHSNWDKMVGQLNKGRNVAMAFTSRTDMPSWVLDEKTGQKFQVWNGDNYDARFLDPKTDDGTGMIVGLTNKDKTGKPENAAADNQGFFLDYDKKRDGDTLTIKDQSKLDPARKVIQIAKSDEPQLSKLDKEENPHAKYDGVKVKQQIRIADTGDIATLHLDAGEALRELDDRAETFRRLMGCLK